MHVRSDNFSLVFMHHASVGCLADVSEETNDSILSAEECKKPANQPQN